MYWFSEEEMDLIRRGFARQAIKALYERVPSRPYIALVLMFQTRLSAGNARAMVRWAIGSQDQEA